MTGKIIQMNDGSRVCIDGPDGYGRARVGRCVYRWEHDDRFGPLFLRRDGMPLNTQPGMNRRDRRAWHEWMKWAKHK